MSKKKPTPKEEVKSVEQANTELAQAHDRLPVTTQAPVLNTGVELIKANLELILPGHREIDLAVSDAKIALEKVASLLKFIEAAQKTLKKK